MSESGSPDRDRRDFGGMVELEGHMRLWRLVHKKVAESFECLLESLELECLEAETVVEALVTISIVSVLRNVISICFRSKFLG